MVSGAVSGADRSGRGGALHASAQHGAHLPHSRYVAAARARVALGEAAAAEEMLLSVLSGRQRAECIVQAEYVA